MSFRLTIARRYLAGRRRVTLVSVISTLSMIGVALGVTALIVVVSVMNGFFDVVRNLLVSFDPHIRIESVEGRHIENPEELMALAWQIDGVESVAAYVEGKAMLNYSGAPGATHVVVVRGIDPESLTSESTERHLSNAIVSGRFLLDPPDNGSVSGIVVGQTLSSQLGLYPGLAGAPGSRITLLSAPGLERLLTQPLGLPPQQPFDVRGIYELQPQYDQTHVFIGIEEAQRLFRMPDQLSGIELRLRNLDNASAVQAELRRHLDPEVYRVSTWYDLQRALYDVMRLEKWGATFILMLIVVVAAFNIVGSLTMIVIEKRRDLGVLRAMGATRKDIRQIFMLEGLLIGLFGAGFGLIVGLGLAFLQQTTGLVPLGEAEAFIISSYPVSIRFLDISVIVVVSVLLCILAAIYPASRAASVEPALAVQAGT